MALPMPEVVDAPPIAPPQSGLIPAAEKIGRVHEVDNDRFGLGGIEFRPETVGSANARSTQTDNVGADVNESADLDRKFDPAVPGGELVAGYPVALTVEESCSAMSIRDDQQYIDRAKRRLTALGGKILEREFWTGEVARADALDPSMYQWLAQIRNTTDPAKPFGAVDLTPAGGAVDPRHALAILEEALGDSGTGAGFLHMSRQMGILMPDRWTEGPIVTWPDSIVAVGAGYPGSGPDGNPAAPGESWVYGTSLVDVWLGSVQIWPTTLAEALDRQKNTISYRAERFGSATWDGNVHVAIRVTV